MGRDASGGGLGRTCLLPCSRLPIFLGLIPPTCHQSPCVPLTSRRKEVSYSYTRTATCCVPPLHPSRRPGHLDPTLCPSPLPRLFSVPCIWGDTVAADEQDDEIDADEHPWIGRAAVGQDPVVHHGIPVLTCQHLEGEGGWATQRDFRVFSGDCIVQKSPSNSAPRPVLSLHPWPRVKVPALLNLFRGSKTLSLALRGQGA